MADQGTSNLYQGDGYAGGILGLSQSTSGMYSFFTQSDESPDRDGSLLLASTPLADGYFGNVFFTSTYPNFFVYTTVDSDRDGGVDYSSKGRAGGLMGNASITASFPNYFSFSDANSGGGGGTVVTTYYKVRGYYVVGAVYETYVTTTLPGTNPTGHALIDLTIVSTWRV